MTTQNKENDSIRIGILKKYVGVQSWQMRSQIRVEQKRNQVKKEIEMGEKEKN